VRGRPLERMRGGGWGSSKPDPLATDEAKTLYAMGCSVGRQIGDLTCLPPTEIDTLLIGVRDVLTRTTLQVELSEYMPKAAELLKARSAEESARFAKEGEEVLAAAAATPSAQVTESGLVVRMLSEGKGDFPTTSDTVRFNFEGRLPDGTVIDISTKPVEIVVSAAPTRGLQEGLQHIRPGGKAILTMPSSLGFGDKGQSVIPPMATLVFEIELLANLGPKAFPASAVQDDDADTSVEDDVY